MAEQGNRSRSHGLSSELLFKQSEKLNIKMIQKYTSWDDYESVFINTIKELKKNNVEYGIFGDIDLQVHLEWIIKICNKTGIQYFEPLWKYKRMNVIKELLEAGFRAIIVSCDSKKMDKKYLGKEIKFDLVNELQSIGIDAAGENGEFHTFIYDGPIFKSKVKFNKRGVVENKKYLFLEIE